MHLFRFAIIISSLLISQAAYCADNQWLLGVYADTLNKLNVKGGFTFFETKPGNSESFDFGSFKYTDFEVGYEGNKVTLGAGLYSRHGLDRIGISYAQMKTQDLVGVESVMSYMGGSVKLGYYFGLNDTANRFLFGFGFGF